MPTYLSQGKLQDTRGVAVVRMELQLALPEELTLPKHIVKVNVSSYSLPVLNTVADNVWIC